MPKLDPDSLEYRRRAKRDAEEADLDVWLFAYEGATGEKLEVVDSGESPDFVCLRSDGSEVGVELTQIRRSPNDIHWERILDRKEHMSGEEAASELWNIISQKAHRLPKYRTQRTILVVAIRESNFENVVNFAQDIPGEDFESLGFVEIWLIDTNGIISGAHREAPIFGLHPTHYRTIFGRSAFDQKPFG